MVKAAVENALKQLRVNLKKHKGERTRIWQSFCKETPLQGFGFFHRSQFNYERVLWLVLILSAMGGTIYSSKETINDFLNGELVTKTSLIPVAEASFANLTICIDTYNWDQLLDNDSTVLDKEQMTDIFMKYDKEILAFFDLPNKISVQNGSSEVMELFKRQPYLILILRLAFILTTEVTYFQFAIAISQTFAPMSSTQYKFLASETYGNSSLQLLGNFIISHSLNNSEVAKTTGFILCLLFDVRAAKAFGVKSFYGLNLYDDESVCDWASLSWMQHNSMEQYDRMCMRQLVSDPTVPIFSVRSNMSMLIHSNPRRVTSDRRTKMIVDFSGNPTIDSYSMAVDTYMGEANFIDVQLDEIWRYVSKDKPCRMYRGQMHCIMDRLHESILKGCNCHILFTDSPLRDCYQLNNISYEGDIENDLYCTNAKTPPPRETHCQLAPCEESNFQFAVNTDTRMNTWDRLKFNLTSTRTKMEFSMPRVSYVRLVESLKIDSSTFVANLGGSLGLYIGGSFLALIHLLTSVVRLLVSLVLAKEDKNQKNEERGLETVTTEH